MHVSGGGVLFEAKMISNARHALFVLVALPWHRFGPTRTASPLPMRSWVILILVVFGWPSYTQCQQTSQSNNVSYEGQKVAAAELVANPKISVESLRSLVQQRADEPYSSSKVADTISALEGMGRFSKVEVDRC
jgi:outer membrane protein assembly factor BamA